ncbi:hypothetical protein SAMN05444358_104125 [Ruegeria halocynthiae]|uniref:Chalcone isomerase-like n=1 Tax=Ruegeria halocynthiae TaxID=985054 RepID=A0A1H3ACD6_9RHOB|nr:hypothetical protein [Ruegeria halocynthiae]SDX27316.1 hypothetical protein SAMN05444358_104125 [Ruegeria halocynthiae]
MLFAPGGLSASPVFGAFNDAELRGTATFRYLGFPIYDAQLFTQGGTPLNWSQDFGLELRYRRNISKKALVNSTLDEMKRIGRAAPVRNQLEVCFGAVSKGDRYLAISQGPDKVAFWLNGQKVCTMSYPGIKRSFMSIFLGDNTRSAAFTRSLRGN